MIDAVENDIDTKINSLVIEKKLLNESLKRSNSDIEKQEIKKRLIFLNGEIYKLRHSRNEIIENSKSTK